MIQRRHFLNAFLILTILLTAIFSAFAHTNSDDVFVRVVSANPQTHTYTFSWSMNPTNTYLRDWFIRPDNGEGIDDAEEAQILDLPSETHLTYTFEENTIFAGGQT